MSAHDDPWRAALRAMRELGVTHTRRIDVFYEDRSKWVLARISTPLREPDDYALKKPDPNYELRYEVGGQILTRVESWRVDEDSPWRVEVERYIMEKRPGFTLALGHSR